MQRLDALVRNTPDSRFNRPSPRTRPFPPPDSLPPRPGTSVEFSSSRGRLAPNQSHLSFPQQPGAGFPKADPPTPESEVLSPVRGHDSQPTRIPGGGGGREGAHSPKRADLRKGRGGNTGPETSPPSPSPHPNGAPPHQRLAGPEVRPAGSSAAAGARDQGGRAAGPASRPRSRTLGAEPFLPRRCAPLPEGPEVPDRYARGSGRPAVSGRDWRAAGPARSLPASPAAAPAARRGCSYREGGDGGGHKPGASPTSQRAPRPQRGPAPGGAPLLLSLCPRLSAWPWRPRSRPTPRPPARDPAARASVSVKSPSAPWGEGDPGTWGPS